MQVTRYSLGHGLLDAVACMSLARKALAAAALLLHRSGIIVKRYMKLCYGYVMVMLWLLLLLLCQPGERLCYGCHASQERINVSAVPTAP